MSAQSSSVASASFSATAADEAAAISAGYVKGRTTVYYTDCKRLPTMQSRPAHAGSRSAPQGSTPASMQLGDFSFLPHPGYAGRSGKTVSQPLYLHHLIS